MKRRSKVKLSDIAQVCGVGSSTVSRVLNGVSDGFSVKPKIRENILATARKMNYVPNAMAKNLRTNKTKNILIFGFKFSWTSLQSMYGYILETCTELLIDKGYTVNAVFTPSGKITPGMLMADGAILLTASDKIIIEKLNNANIPFVIINDSYDNSCCWLDIDDDQGTKLAMDHLLKSNHHRIAYCGPLEKLVHDSHKSIIIRKQVYTEVIRSNNLTPFIFDDSFDPVSIAGKLKEQNITAVLVYNNNHAEIIRSVCNYIFPADSIPEIVTFSQKLTNETANMVSVRADFNEISKVTVNYLLDSINNNRVFNKTFTQKLYK